MKNILLRQVLRYVLVFSLAFGLMWLSFRNLTTIEGQDRGNFLWQVWKRSSGWYLWAMAFFSIISHVLRAYRWNLLLASAGYLSSLHTSFIAVMVGYLFNLALPRGGELFRCYNLLKMEKIPVSVSFGTVVAERSVDLLCLFFVVLLSLGLEWGKLDSLIIPWGDLSGSGIFLLLAGTGIAVVLAVPIVYLLRKNEKLASVFTNFRKGFFSLLRLDNLTLFTAISVLMWVLYFTMTYWVMLAFPETRNLGLRAAMMLFAVSSVALSIPLPGGMGSYHTLVPSALVLLYSVARSDAIAIVFVLHAWQTVVVLVPGVLSLLISYQFIRWKKHVKN